MSQFITTDAANLFIEKSIKFENKNLDIENIPIQFNDAKFGILNLKTSNVPLSEQNVEHEIIFMVDCSGSMSDTCSDGRNKMQHIVHTLKNMILYFKENSNIKFHVTIYSFDSHIYHVLERSIVTNENFAEILAKVDSIMPRESTNIELALLKVRECVDKIKESYPSNNISHIFMTDGEVTSGNKYAEDLTLLVDRTITNAFIGFGVDHDSDLLGTIGSGEKTNYYFVDKLENSGLVYGEILHDIVYKFMTNVRLTIQNGLIYDFKKNIWVESFNVGELVSEANKTYHIASVHPNDCFITITGTIETIETTNKEQNFEVIISCREEDQSEELTKYIYRQRTLQHLYNVKDFVKRNATTHALNYTLHQEEIKVKNTLRKFMEEMKNYMKNNDLTNDNFMKNLCDDIFICYRIFNTRFASMFINARQTSQGSQRYYSVRETPQLQNTNENFDDFDVDDLNTSTPTQRFPSPLKLTRQNNRKTLGLYMNDVTDTLVCLDRDRDDLDFTQHQLSNFNDDPYLTPTSTQIMREISSTRNIVVEKEKIL
jgi:hypothetical protein